jgi:hypothetical protein
MHELKLSYAEKPKILHEINQLKATIEVKNEDIQELLKHLNKLKKKIMIFQLEMCVFNSGKTRFSIVTSKRSLKRLVLRMSLKDRSKCPKLSKTE